MTTKRHSLILGLLGLMLVSCSQPVIDTTRSDEIPQPVHLSVSESKLLASDQAPGDRFGTSVAISGDTAVVGTQFDNDVYVFTNGVGGWSEAAILNASDGGDGFGWSVAISGDTVIVGAYADSAGSAYVFEKPAGGWSGTLNENAKLTASDGQASPSDQFGWSVAISGDTVIVGAYFDDSATGSAYVFEKPLGGWSGPLTEDAKLLAGDAALGDQFGFSVAISGNTAVVGSHLHDHFGIDAGSAYVFSYNGISWTQQAELTPIDLFNGGSDAGAADRFGNSVAINGNTVVVGSFLDDHSDKNDAGSAHVFSYNGTWTQEAKLTALEAAAADQFGFSVAISNDTISSDTILVGSPADDDAGSSSGSAYLFVRTGPSTTVEVKLTAFDGAANDTFGHAVAISDSRALVGSPLDDDACLPTVNPTCRSGSAYAILTELPDPPTEFAYVADGGHHRIFVIDTATNSVDSLLLFNADPLPFPFIPTPRGIAFTPDGTRAYVADSTAPYEVLAIDTAARTSTVVPVSGGVASPNTVAITPDGTLAYVTNSGSGNVSVIDTDINTVVATVPVGNNPSGVAITPDGTLAYVTNSGSGNVSVIDTDINTVVATVPVGNNPSGVAITPDGTYAYVTNFLGDSVSVIDTATNTVVATVGNCPGTNPFGVAITTTPLGVRAYVANKTHVCVIDTTPAVVDQIDTFGQTGVNNARELAITLDGIAYVATRSGEVSVIDTDTNTVIATIVLGGNPERVAVTSFVTNQIPTANAGGPYNVNEGGSVQLNGSGTDPDPGDPLTFEWDLDYDGATFDVDATVQNPPFDASSLDGPDVHTVALRVTDSVGATSAIDTTAVTVDNVAPTIDLLTAPLEPVNINDLPVNVVVAFSDPGSADTHDVTWDWDDGNSDFQNGAISPASLIHDYTDPGVYTVTVTVADDDGGSVDAQHEFIVIYDPEGGFVTGGGWIDSPASACTVFCGGATGTANFGFVSKYKKGAQTPTGNTEFNFTAGGLNFHSDTYDWLVINQGGTNAQYKGAGTINNELAPNSEPYKFMIWAKDLSPSDDDTFRIKIWYDDGGEVVVYDNGFDQLLGGGNIRVHKGN